MNNPRKSKRRSIRTRGTIETHKDLISNLPDEILLEIIECLRNERSYSVHYQRKINQSISVVYSDYTGSTYDTAIAAIYRYNPESPIFNSLQSFSVVNRRIYSLCRPIIWQSLQFWADLTGVISFWNQELLPKHGSYVRKLDVQVDGNWLKIPNLLSVQLGTRDESLHPHTMKSSDIGTVDISEHHKPMYGSELSFSKLATPVQKAILEVEHDMVLFGTKAVNAEDLVKLLSHCKKITTLNLCCVHDFRYPTSEEIHSSTSYFTSLFSNLARLQHLKVMGCASARLPRFFIQSITNIKLLESLHLSLISLDNLEQVDQNLAACFSNFKNLKRLVLSYVRGIEILQGSCTGPPNLVDLVIRNCPGLKLPHIPQLISSWAPHLTHFTLKLYEYEDPSLREDILDFDPRRNQFYLLGLTHLTIRSHSKSHYIQCFSSCKNLVQLTFVLCTSTTEEMPDGQADALSAVSDFITTNEFHRLQKIVLIKTDQNPIDSVSASALFPLEEFCRSKGIKLSGF